MLQPEYGNSGTAMTAQVDHDTCVRLTSSGGTPRHQHEGRWNSYGAAAGCRLRLCEIITEEDQYRVRPCTAYGCDVWSCFIFLPTNYTKLISQFFAMDVHSLYNTLALYDDVMYCIPIAMERRFLQSENITIPIPPRKELILSKRFRKFSVSAEKKRMSYAILITLE